MNHRSRHDEPRRNGSERRLYAWMAFFTLALFVLGGGTRPALTSDFILQLLALPLIWRMIMRFPAEMPRPWLFLTLAVALFFLWQLLPWPANGKVRFPNTLDAGATLQSLFILLVAVAYFWNALSLPVDARERLVGWMLVGVAINIVIAFLQFASPAFAGAFQPFSWEMTAGFFANENHLAILLAVTAPFIVAWFQRTPWPLLSWLPILLLMAFQVVVGSRAGVTLILVSALLSVTFVQARSTRLTLGMLALIAAAAAVVALHMPETLTSDFEVKGRVFSRGIFLQNTWRALLDHLPFGAGIGTFTLVYPKYEQATGITHLYVNHAHNDWLELLLEGGVFAGMLLAGFLIALLASAIRNRPLTAHQRAALIACGGLMLHSLVDYPLRTLALACTFALCVALIVASKYSREECPRL